MSENSESPCRITSYAQTRIYGRLDIFADRVDPICKNVLPAPLLSLFRAPGHFIGEEKIYTGATLFLGEEFVRITETESGKAINTYYGWDGISSVRTIAKVSESS